LGEGLTDFLALTIACAAPVLSAPGSGLAAHAIGPWIAGFDVLLALDDDAAGANACMPTADAAYHHGARSVRQVVWPGHAKDACDVIEQRGIDALTAYLTRELEVLARG
jgi:DNA primase